MDVSALTNEELNTVSEKIKTQLQHRRTEYLIKQAHKSTMSDLKLKQIVNSPRSSFVLSLPDYAKVSLAIDKERERMWRGGRACFWPIVKAKDTDAEYDDLFSI